MYCSLGHCVLINGCRNQSLPPTSVTKWSILNSKGPCGVPESPALNQSTSRKELSLDEFMWDCWRGGDGEEGGTFLHHRPSQDESWSVD